MKNMCLLPVWAVLLIIAGTFFSCEKKKDMAIYRQADSLNLLSYRMRYKNLDTACKAAHDAYKLADGFPSLRAGALNNQGFCAFIHMDFEKAEDLFLRVYEESNNELECLIADIGMMKICQRTAMNKEFYDYRNSALRRMKRISDDRSAITDPGELERLNYARSEFSIASAIYYYYLQQEQQSLEAINEIKVDEALESDTAQLLYYYYMKGSGGMYEADTPQDVVLGEFNYLIECLGISREYGYVYFEANASQAMAELLKERKNFDLIMERRPNVMRAINNEDLSWEELTMRFAWQALDLFKKYGDLYQISGTYRTLASCSNEQGSAIGVRSHHGSVMFAGIGIASQQTEHARQGFNAVRVLWPLYAQRHCLQKLNKKAERKYYTVLEFKILMMALAIVVASSSVFCLPKETRIVPRAYSSER